jgi:hypothetical protein
VTQNSSFSYKTLTEPQAKLVQTIPYKIFLKLSLTII